jgi:hypothetical protein
MMGEKENNSNESQFLSMLGSYVLLVGDPSN